MDRIGFLAAEIIDSGAVGRAVLASALTATARSAIGLGAADAPTFDGLTLTGDITAPFGVFDYGLTLGIGASASFEGGGWIDALTAWQFRMVAPDGGNATLSVHGINAGGNVLVGGYFGGSSGALPVSGFKVYPYNDNYTALGDASHYWSNVYSMALNLGGAPVTGSGSGVTIGGNVIATNNVAGVQAVFSGAGTFGGAVTGTATSGNGYVGFKVIGAGKVGGSDASNGIAFINAYTTAGNRQMWIGASDAGTTDVGLRLVFASGELTLNASEFGNPGASRNFSIGTIGNTVTFMGSASVGGNFSSGPITCSTLTASGAAKALTYGFGSGPFFDETGGYVRVRNAAGTANTFFVVDSLYLQTANGTALLYTDGGVLYQRVNNCIELQGPSGGNATSLRMVWKGVGSIAPTASGAALGSRNVNNDADFPWTCSELITSSNLTIGVGGQLLLGAGGVRGRFSFDGDGIMAYRNGSNTKLWEFNATSTSLSLGTTNCLHVPTLQADGSIRAGGTFGPYVYHGSGIGFLDCGTANSKTGLSVLGTMALVADGSTTSQGLGSTNVVHTPTIQADGNITIAQNFGLIGTPGSNPARLIRSAANTWQMDDGSGGTGHLIVTGGVTAGTSFVVGTGAANDPKIVKSAANEFSFVNVGATQYASVKLGITTFYDQIVANNQPIIGAGAIGCTTLTASGSISGTVVNASSGVAIGSTVPLLWNSRAVVRSPADAKMKWGNAAETLGVVLDFSTADTLKIRNYADNADGALTCGAITASSTARFPAVRTGYINEPDNVYSVITLTASSPHAVFAGNITAAAITTSGIPNFTATMGDSTKNPATDAPDEWFEFKKGGVTYYVPAYLA